MMVEVQEINSEHAERIILQPNRSLEWKTVKKILLVASSVILSVALLFTFKGAWLVLPYAGLEILALAGGFWLVFQRLDRQQVLLLNDEQVIVEQGRHTPQQRWVCHRPWCRFRVYRPHPWYPRQIWLRCHSNRVQIGDFLTDEERKQLQRHLNHLLIHD